MSDHKHKYYLPRGDEALFDWTVNFVQECTAHAAEWGIPASALAAIGSKNTAYGALVSKCKQPTASSVDVAEKNQAKTILEHVIQGFVNEHIRYNKSIDDASRVKIGVPPQDKIKTPGGPITQLPVFECEPSKIRQTLLRWHVDDDESHAIPYGCAGIQLAKKVLGPDEAIPTDPEELEITGLVTTNPHTDHHAAADSGKRCAYAGYFQGTSGKTRGDWGPIVVTVVP